MKTLPFWATLLTCLGFTILCGLGTWQLQRLSWKADLLATLDAQISRGPVPMTADDIAALLTKDSGSGYAALQGRFHTDQSIYLGPRTHEGKPGYHVITPLEIDTYFILVNRGWIPFDAEKNPMPPDRKFVGVEGFIRPIPEPNIFTPANDPEAEDWYWLDRDALSDKMGIDDSRLFPLMVTATAENPVPASMFVAQTSSMPRPNNNHLSYAIFWFSLAATLLIVYYLRFIR